MRVSAASPEDRYRFAPIEIRWPFRLFYSPERPLCERRLDAWGWIARSDAIVTLQRQNMLWPPLWLPDDLLAERYCMDGLRRRRGFAGRQQRPAVSRHRQAARKRFS